MIIYRIKKARQGEEQKPKQQPHASLRDDKGGSTQHHKFIECLIITSQVFDAKPWARSRACCGHRPKFDRHARPPNLAHWLLIWQSERRLNFLGGI
uniref:Uncharacterized protein n=1 Tax=Dunaliella viridis TaxID=140095 RepID=A7U4W7_9CHLO|nr:hypothetical protein [Dunaliella viridis]